MKQKSTLRSVENNYLTHPTEAKGITLITLVVTIIVLLILAGISITMLSGENSILYQAGKVRDITGKGSVIEKAKIDILGEIAESKEHTLTKNQLKTILNRYFDNIDSLVIPDDLSNTDIKLTANQANGGYTDIALVDIYNGKFSVEKLVSGLYETGTNNLMATWKQLKEDGDITVVSGTWYTYHINSYGYEYDWTVSTADGTLNGTIEEFESSLTENGYEFQRTATVNAIQLKEIDEYITGDLVIDEEITKLGSFGGYPRACGEDWYIAHGESPYIPGNINLTGITIPGSIQEIGDYTFTACNTLKKIELNEGIKRIGTEAFHVMARKYTG